MTGWTKHHRIEYLLLAVASADGEPAEAALKAVFREMGEFTNLGLLPMGDETFDSIWTAVWLQQHDDRRPGPKSLFECVTRHALALTREVPRADALTILVAMVRIAKCKGEPSNWAMGQVAICGEAFGLK